MATETPEDKKNIGLRPLIDDSDHRVERLLGQRRGFFLRRLFPDKADEAAAAYELLVVQSGIEYRQKAMHLAVETRLQATEEMCNQVLVTGKAEIRRERQEFFAAQRMALEEKLSPMVDKFIRTMEERYARMKEITVPRLREREEKRLNRSVDEFMELVDDLLSEFTAIIHEGVGNG